MTSDKPSIAELRTVSDWCTDADLDDWASRLGPAARADMMIGALIAEVRRHRDAAPAFLEIAAAGKAWAAQRADNLHAALLRTKAELEAEAQDIGRARVKRTAELAAVLEAALAKVLP